MSQDNHALVGGLRDLPRKQIIITFVGVLLAMFLSSLDQTVVGTAMPRIVADLGGFNQYTWVTTAYIITSAIAIPITGKLTDLYGRKYFYMGGIIIFILASVACGLSNTMTQIIVFRGIQGLGGGVMMANAFTVIGDMFPPAVRGKYQGMMSAVFGLSAVVGPTLGGYITDNLTWHWVFFVNVPLGAIVIALFIFFFPHLRPDRLKHIIDYPGVALLVFTVAPLLLALSWGGVEYAWSSPIIIVLFAVAAVSLGLFIFVESRSPEPLIPLSLFNNRIVTVSSLLILCTSMGMFGVITFITLFFQGVLGSTATASGNYVTPMMLGMVTGSFLSGQALARLGGRYKLQGAIGVGIMMVGLFLLSRMNINTTSGAAIRNMIIAGFGLGITMPLYTIAIQNAVPYKILGVATSASAFFRSIGGSLGLAIFGSIMSNRFAGALTARIPADLAAAVPPAQLNSLIHNPEALMSADAQTQLQNLVAPLGDKGASLIQQFLQALKESLALSISHVFTYAFAAVVLAFVINFFIKEIPLRAHHGTETPKPPAADVQ